MDPGPQGHPDQVPYIVTWEVPVYDPPSPSSSLTPAAAAAALLGLRPISGSRSASRPLREGRPECDGATDRRQCEGSCVCLPAARDGPGQRAAATPLGPAPRQTLRPFRAAP